MNTTASAPVSTPIDQLPRGSVVVGVDGSDDSERALRWAADQAAREHRPLTMLLAYGAPVWAVPPAAVVVEDQGLVDRIAEESKRTLEAAARRVKERHPDLEVATVTADMDAREALLRLSEHASLLVIGSRGRGPAKSMLLGSVSAYVGQRAHCPVVVTRPRGAGSDDSLDEASEDLTRLPVIVGTDGTPVSAPALEFAFRQASQRGLPLTVVHCFSDVFVGGYGLIGIPDEDLENLDAERRLLAEAVAGLREKFPDVEVTFELGRGGAARYLALASERASLLVVGSRHRPGRRTFALDAVSRPVLEHATSPVAVVPSFS